MRPVAWSSSYLFRWPFGISTVTSNCTAVSVAHGGPAPDQVTAGLPRPPGPGRAARRLAAERAATQAAIEQALAERAAADRVVEEQVARERARRPALPIPTAVPDEPRDSAPQR